MYRRVRPYGLAAGLGVRLARLGGVRHLALAALHRRWVTFANRRRQAIEVAIAASVLNRMLELGRPEYIRIA